jgi:hypothetical protein
VWPDRGPARPLPGPGADPAPPPLLPPAALAGVIPRSGWTSAAPATGQMRPMLPVHYVTIHHSAGPVFDSTDRSATVERLESIRRYHRETLGWGDIGYHFAVDRAGRVWECRSLRWQGAHVRDFNEANLGVVLLGNFDEQEPGRVQLEAMQQHVLNVMRVCRVPVARLRTHQEWAPTACPGRALQRHMVSQRAAKAFG